MANGFDLPGVTLGGGIFTLPGGIFNGEGKAGSETPPYDHDPAPYDPAPYDPAPYDPDPYDPARAAQARIEELQALVGPCLDSLAGIDQKESLSTLFRLVLVCPFFPEANDIIFKGILEKETFFDLVALLKEGSSVVRAQAASLIMFAFDWAQSHDVPLSILAYSWFFKPAADVLVNLLAAEDPVVLGIALDGLCPAISADKDLILRSEVIGPLCTILQRPDGYNGFAVLSVVNQISQSKDGAAAIQNNRELMGLVEGFSAASTSHFSTVANKILNNIRSDGAFAMARLFALPLPGGSASARVEPDIDLSL